MLCLHPALVAALAGTSSLQWVVAARSVDDALVGIAHSPAEQPTVDAVHSLTRLLPANVVVAALFVPAAASIPSAAPVPVLRPVDGSPASFAIDGVVVTVWMVASSPSPSTSSCVPSGFIALRLQLSATLVLPASPTALPAAFQQQCTSLLASSSLVFPNGSVLSRATVARAEGDGDGDGDDDDDRVDSIGATPAATLCTPSGGASTSGAGTGTGTGTGAGSAAGKRKDGGKGKKKPAGRGGAGKAKRGPSSSSSSSTSSNPLLSAADAHALGSASNGGHGLVHIAVLFSNDDDSSGVGDSPAGAGPVAIVDLTVDVCAVLERVSPARAVVSTLLDGAAAACTAIAEQVCGALPSTPCTHSDTLYLTAAQRLFLPTGCTFSLPVAVATAYSAIAVDVDSGTAAASPAGGETATGPTAVRRAAHETLALACDRPRLRAAAALPWSLSAAGVSTGGDATAMYDGVLADVHVGDALPPSKVVGGTQHTVKGSYLYYHYMQQRFNDKGWGCAYRSMQVCPCCSSAVMLMRVVHQVGLLRLHAWSNVCTPWVVLT
jgi:hypothetical protein